MNTNNNTKGVSNQFYIGLVKHTVQIKIGFAGQQMAEVYRDKETMPLVGTTFNKHTQLSEIMEWADKCVRKNFPANTIDNESLEDAIYRRYPDGETSYELEMEREAFANGSKWQEQKDAHTIGLLTNKLKSLIYVLEIERKQISISLSVDYKTLYKESKELLQSLK